MWYFSWILGTGLACVFAVLNAVWLELRRRCEAVDEDKLSVKLLSFMDSSAT
ncbi:cytochrome bd-I oxidase subunit CydX [Legionella pneumophila]|nr:cytochrome bd-I oxidase subunit CydX [Legionella pneumophila]